MKKLVTSLLLIALLANSAAYISCGDTPSPSGVSDESTDAETTPVETEPPLEVKDFENHTLRVLTRDDGATAWRTLDLVAETETGDAINDAVYKRNTAVFDAYNVKIERVIVDFGQTANIVKQSVLAGSDDYDLVLNILTNQAKLSSEDCLYDLTTVPGINLSHKCWDPVGNDCMQIGGKIFCVMGDINITDNDAKINTAFGKSTTSLPTRPSSSRPTIRNTRRSRISGTSSPAEPSRATALSSSWDTSETSDSSATWRPTSA